MSSVAERLMQRLNLTSSRFQAIPYEYLRYLPRYKETKIKLLGKPFKVADPLSFYWSFREIFSDHIYKFDTAKKAPVILDCGSNYGTSISYFKKLYPSAKITGVEADPNIYNLLNWNIQQQGYSDVTLINRAVSATNVPVAFYHEGADGGRVLPLSDQKEVFEVQTIHLDELIQEPIDFLKMDIEGSETAVICASEKLHMVDQIFIEYHSFKDSTQTLSSLLEALTAQGFRYYIHTQFCSPRPLTEEKLQLGMDLQLNIFAKRKR